MMEGVIVLLLSGSVGFALWRLAEQENRREHEQFIERVGGPNSPWIADVKKEPTPQFWNGFDSRYTPDEQVAIERDPTWGLHTSAAPPSTSPSTSAPSPQPPQHISAYETSTAPQPAVEVVATTGCTTGCGDSAQDWLSENSCFFPIAVPPIQIEYPKDQRALITATHWITKALDAGVSQNKIVTVVFRKSKGTADYDRITEIIRSVRG